MSKWRRLNAPSFRPKPPDRRAALNAGKARARDMLDRSQIDEALPHLQQLVIDYPDDGDLQMMYAMCLFATGDSDTALIHYERAYAMDKDPAILYPLGVAYLGLAMYGSALHAFTESNRRGLPLPDAMLPTLTQLRQDVGAMAHTMHLPLEKAIVGLREMEQGTRWLDRNDFPRAIATNRAAIKVLGAWPPPHNNLAIALFFDGQPAAAIAECRQVLAREPENLMAAGNLVRFLAWSGERAGAEESWRSLSTRSPIDLPADVLKLAEAAAVMDDDESVRRFLLPLADWSPDEIGGWRQYVQAQQFLATADANLGDPKAAKRRLRALNYDSDLRVKTLHDALRQRKAGLGLTPRFPYFRSFEVAPRERLEEFMALMVATDDDDPKAGKNLSRFVARFPQLVLMAEKLIWDEDAIGAGIGILRHVGTPAAHAALRRFAGGQAGSDEERMHALFALQASGGAQPGELFRIWRDDAWQEIQLRSFAIGPRQDRPQYKAKVVKLMDEAQTATHAGQWAEAIPLLRQVIELEPRAVEAFNNLAAALDMIGDREASSAMLERALTINPTYVFARVNLALKLIGQDVDAAAAFLAPLEVLDTFMPEEFTFYQFGLARIAVARDDFKAARNLLRMALSVDPAYEPATKLLASLDEIEFHTGSGEIWAKIRERTAARNAQHRHKQAGRLKTLTPSLADTIGIYSAELLRPMARAVAPGQRLTGLRKAELQQLVLETLFAPATVEALATGRLSATECAVLAAVLAVGGAMPQQQFRATYGDDAAESPWWQYELPTSVAGRLRLHCLLVEATVAGVVYLAIPAELRGPLATALTVQ